MATTGSWIYGIARERQEGWRRQDEQDRRTMSSGPDATHPDGRIVTSGPDTGRRGRGLSFHGLLHRWNSSARP